MTEAPPPVLTTRRRWQRPLVVAASGFVVWWAASFTAAWAMTAPHPSPVAPRTELAGHAVAPVEVTTADGVPVRGWLIDASKGTRCVVFAAGVGGTRLAMLARSEWYLARGWSTLLVDLRGTGESGAARISMGFGERLDLASWHTFLRGRGYRTVGAHGQSLGAAAIVYTAELASPPQWDFAVLEACYLDIDAAMTARVAWLPAWAHWTAWPLYTCAAWLTGAAAEDLSPLRAITSLHAPTLFACGTEDTKVGPDAMQRLFAASAATDRRQVAIEGAAHVDLWSFGPTLPRALEEFLAERH